MPGQILDPETGFHYNYHRYYDPRTGRYITPDPIGLDGGINLYAYALNNPVNLIDPWGLQAGYKGIRGFIMKLGERHYRKSVQAFFNKWGYLICDMAEQYMVDPAMLFAIFKEELSHMLPLEYPFEIYIGIGETVGPGQINVNHWSKQLGLSRETLTDISINIDAAAEIISINRQRLREDNLPVSPEMLGSRYNDSQASNITNYGKRIGNFHAQLKNYADEECSVDCD